MRGIARPIRMLPASEEIRADLRRRTNGRSTKHCDRFRKAEGAEILAKIKRAGAALGHAKAVM